MSNECKGQLLRLATGELYYSCSVDHILRQHQKSVDCPTCKRKINAEVQRDIPTRIISELQRDTPIRVINVKQIQYQGDWITVS